MYRISLKTLHFAGSMIFDKIHLYIFLCIVNVKKFKVCVFA
jgi:hypothetical protein